MYGYAIEAPSVSNPNSGMRVPFLQATITGDTEVRISDLRMCSLSASPEAVLITLELIYHTQAQALLLAIKGAF